MGTAKRFKIVYSPDADVNKFMRACDLMHEGEGIYTENIFSVTWKDGEVVDEARVERTAANLKKAIKMAGGEVISITEVLPERKLI